MSFLGMVLSLAATSAVSPPVAADPCFASALPEIGSALTREDSLALAERYLAAPPGGDTRCGEVLAGFLLGMNSSPAQDAWRERQRASELIERALRDYAQEPRLYLALAVVLHHRQSRTDALRNLDRAVDRSAGAEVPLSAREMAILHYTRATIQQDFWRDWRSFGQIDAVSIGQWRCSRDQAPTQDNFSSSSSDNTWLIAVNQLCSDVFAENMGQYFQPRSDMNLDARDDMAAAFARSWDADPSFLGAPEGLLSEWIYAADWPRVDSLTQLLRERFPEEPRFRLYRALVLHETGRDSLATVELMAANAVAPDSLERILNDVRPLLRVDQQEAYDALDTLGQREVRVAFWTSLDPLFLTTWNERRLEHVSRVVAASVMFAGDTFGETGAQTLAGQMWIRYGRPINIWELQAPIGRVVFWDFGPGPDISFLRGFGYRGYRPTDQAVEIGNVLARTSPQTYAMTALVDSVLALEAQVVRTLGPSLRPQLLVYGEWPARAGAGSRAGLTLLDLQYFPVAQWRGGKPTRPGIGAELNGMAAGTYSLTVEVWDTVQSRLYRVRDTVSTLPAGDGQFVVSDPLLVTEIVTPANDDITQRRELTVTPMYGTTLEKGKTLGVVWETYRLDGAMEGRRRYRVSIELLNAARQPMLARVLRGVSGGGQRAASRIEFESSRPMVEGRTVEWLELSSVLGIGEYRLVFRLTDPETGIESVRERAFRVR